MNNNDLTRVISNILGEFGDWVSIIAEHTPTGTVDITLLALNEEGKTEKYTALNEHSSDLVTVLENYRVMKLLTNKYYHKMCSVLNETLTDREIEALTCDLYKTVYFPFSVPSPLTEFENQEGEGVTVEEFLENIKILKEKLKNG